MTSAPTFPRENALIIAFPIDEAEALHWWLIAESQIIARGQDSNPVTAAGLEQAPPADQVMAVIPESQTVIRWFDLPGLSPRQAEAASRLEALELSIGGGDNIHCAARHDAKNGITVTATISQSVMVKGLAALQEIGLDPAIILPAALVIPAQDDGYTSAIIGSEAVLRGPGVAMSDEREIFRAIAGEKSVAQLAPQQVDTAIVHAYEIPEINLRQGIFAKRSHMQAVDAKGWKILAMLAAVSLILTLVIMGAQWFKYENSIERLNDEALTAAQTVVPEATDLTTAEQRINAALNTRGSGGFMSPVSALFAAMQSAPGVAARDLSYRADGIMTVVLAAPRNEDINPVLITLQNAGYKVTANPRQDSTGQAVADITVRGS